LVSDAGALKVIDPIRSDAAKRGSCELVECAGY